jgi:hypothetical protein
VSFPPFWLNVLAILYWLLLLLWLYLDLYTSCIFNRVHSYKPNFFGVNFNIIFLSKPRYPRMARYIADKL